MRRQKYLIALLGTILILLFLHLYRVLVSMQIIAEFKELRPLPLRVEVLYKGIKVGEVVSSRHSEDFNYTLVKMRIRPRSICLPSNIKAHLMIEKRRFHDYDYIELISPKESAEGKLEAGMVIEGESMVDMRNVFANQSKESIEGIKDNLYNASENLNTTIEALGELFVILQNMVKENQANMQKFTKKLSETTANLESLTGKINAATSQSQFETILDEAQASLENVREASESFQSISENVYKTTESLGISVPKTLRKTEQIIDNVGKISGGVSSTMRKPFGGLRLLFGKTINSCR